METPEHERKEIEDYLRSQSGEDFEIEHVEKLTSEYVLGRQYDVWDAHTNEGRWWLITNPTNLYSQELIKSMDVALSFHIGLMLRAMERQPLRHSQADWILDVLRRVDLAQSSLDRAKEAEDFQAVGMRLREALVSLGQSLAAVIILDGTVEPPKGADFKAWAALAAGQLAPGSDNEYLRGFLKATSDKTWAYVNWLTHARHATELDARLACGMTSQVIEAFGVAVNRSRLGPSERCTACGSYQLVVAYTEDGWTKLCSVCSHSEPAEVTQLSAQRAATPEPSARPADECIEMEDFGIYLSPQQARAMVDAMNQRLESEHGFWGNPFSVTDESGQLADAHRLAFRAFRGGPQSGCELVYDCGNDACVNPGHASEKGLPDELGWAFGIVEEVALHRTNLELKVSSPDGVVRRLYVDRDLLDHYGLADASSLLERVLCLSPADEHGWLRIIVASARGDYERPTPAPGWLHPDEGIAHGTDCPCGSGRPYADCHGTDDTEVS